MNPQGHHHREVERCDAGHHTQGLEQRPGIHVRPDVATVFAFQQLRNPASKFDILDAAGVRNLLRDAEQLGTSHEFRVISSIQTMRGQRTAAVRSGDGYASDMEASRNRRPSLLDEIEAGLPLLDLVRLRLELLRRPRQAAVVPVVLGRRSDRGEVHLRMSRCGLDNGCIVGRDEYGARLAQAARAPVWESMDASPSTRRRSRNCICSMAFRLTKEPDSLFDSTQVHTPA